MAMSRSSLFFCQCATLRGSCLANCSREPSFPHPHTVPRVDEHRGCDLDVGPRALISSGVVRRPCWQVSTCSALQSMTNTHFVWCLVGQTRLCQWTLFLPNRVQPRSGPVLPRDLFLQRQRGVHLVAFVGAIKRLKSSQYAGNPVLHFHLMQSARYRAHPASVGDVPWPARPCTHTAVPLHPDDGQQGL
jgi:hypothetical protein